MNNKQSKFEWWLRRGTTVCLILAAICFVAGIVSWGHGLCLFGSSKKPEDLGNFGSYLQGTVASLWALSGVFLIFVAFLAQTRQMRAQDKQLEEQNKQFEIQQDSIKLQNFENSFFQLLNLQNQITGEILVPVTREQNAKGREAFKPLCTDLRTYISQMHRSQFHIKKIPEKPSPAMELEFVVEQYGLFFTHYQAHLGHYFRNLYHIFKFVKNSEMEDKRRYTSLARAQLSAYELALLVYNGLTPYGEKFKPLIEEFGLLKNLDTSLLIKEEHLEFYNPSARQ